MGTASGHDLEPPETPSTDAYEARPPLFEHLSREQWAETLKSLEDGAAHGRRVADDVEARQAAAEVAADLELVLAELIATGDVEHLERFRLGFASMGDAIELARKRRAVR